MASRVPPSRSGERSALGPAWKVEARGVWKRDYRLGPSGQTVSPKIPVILRVREAREGVFVWEVWSGNRVGQTGESKSAAEAAEHAEYIARASESSIGESRIPASTAARRRGEAKAPPRTARLSRFAPAVVVLLAVAWVAQGVALWLGVGSATLLAVTLAASSVRPTWAQRGSRHCPLGCWRSAVLIRCTGAQGTSENGRPGRPWQTCHLAKVCHQFEPINLNYQAMADLADLSTGSSRAKKLVHAAPLTVRGRDDHDRAQL